MLTSYFLHVFPQICFSTRLLFVFRFVSFCQDFFFPQVQFFPQVTLFTCLFFASFVFNWSHFHQVTFSLVFSLVFSHFFIPQVTFALVLFFLRLLFSFFFYSLGDFCPSFIFRQVTFFYFCYSPGYFHPVLFSIRLLSYCLYFSQGSFFSQLSFPQVTLSLVLTAIMTLETPYIHVNLHTEKLKVKFIRLCCLILFELLNESDSDQSESRM